MPTFHIHLDESGNFDFKSSGTRYYVVAAAWTMDPAPVAKALSDLRISLLKQDHDIIGFHASEDLQQHRDAVVDVLTRVDGWAFNALVIEKGKVPPAFRDPLDVYVRYVTMLLQSVLQTRMPGETDRVMVFTDALPLNKLRKAAAKAIKTACRAELKAGMPFHAYHHPRASNAWLQAADYCSWAVHRKWERGDVRTYQQIHGRLASPELDVLNGGDAAPGDGPSRTSGSPRIDRLAEPEPSGE